METIPTHWLKPQQNAVAARPGGELIHVVGYRKGLILFCMLFAGLAAAVFAIGRERLYQAETRILIDPRGMQIVDRDITPRSESSGDNTALVESQMRVMTSGDVLSKVVAEEHLASDREFMKSSLLSTLRSELGALLAVKSVPTPPDLIALDKLREAVKTTRPKDSYIVELYVRTTDPKKSAQIANAIAETYLAYEAGAHAKLNRRGSGALDRRITQLRAELSNAEEKVEAYKSKYGILSTGGSLINEQALTRLNELLVTARDREVAAQSVYEQMQAIRKSGRIPEALPEAVDSRTIGDLRLAYARTLQSHQALSSGLLPGHPTMKTADAQLASAKGAVHAEIARIADAARAEYEREKSHVRDLEKQVDTLKADAHSTNERMVQLRALTRDAEAKRAVYEAFLVRAKELDEQENVSPNNARIISAATQPLTPVGPGTLLIVALGLAGGLGIGLLLALALESHARRSYPVYRDY